MAKCVLCERANTQAGPVHDPHRADLFGVSCPRCGNFFYDYIRMHHVITEEIQEHRYILSGALRGRLERGQKEPFELTRESVAEILDTARVPETAQENVDNLLLYLASRIDRPWNPITHDKEADYPLLFMKSAQDMNGFIVFARDMGYLREETGLEWKFTIKGWERVEALRAALPDSRQAFVAMWFHDSMNDAYEKGFKPGIEDSEYFSAVRADKVHHIGKVDDWIIAAIRRSGLVVADFTGDRGGVYFEAGFAQGLRIPVVFTCRKDEMAKVHFDTNHFNHIVWETPADLRKQLNDRIVAVVIPEAAKRKG